jgi:hypothetical protein
MNPFTEKAAVRLKAETRCTLLKTTLSVYGPPRREREREPPQTEIVVKNHEMTRSENRD